VNLRDRVLALSELVLISFQRTRDNISFELQPPKDIKSEVAWQRAVEKRRGREVKALEQLAGTPGGWEPSKTHEFLLLQAIRGLKKACNGGPQVVRKTALSEGYVKSIYDWAKNATL